MARTLARLALVATLACSNGKGVVDGGGVSMSTVGTTGGGIGVCAACLLDTDCASGFCDSSDGLCNYSPCDGFNDGGVPPCESAGYTCVDTIEECDCGSAALGATASTSGTTSAFVTITLSSGGGISSSGANSNSSGTGVSSSSSGSSAVSTMSGGSTSSSTSSGGSSSSGGSGTLGALCAPCTMSGDCQSAYCDRSLQECNTANPCASTADCGGLACNVTTGLCLCGSASSSGVSSSGM